MEITIREEGTHNLVVNNILWEMTGDSGSLLDFLVENSETKDGAYIHEDIFVSRRNVNDWDRSKLTGELYKAFIKYVDANERLKICELQDGVRPGERKTKPQHFLYDDDELMLKISNLFFQAFGSELLIDFRGGVTIPIHVGEKPPEEMSDRVGLDYVKLVREYPLLHKQGDGIKSYAGILFETLVADLDVILIDEPEAFLHPPQMRRLGETLSSNVQGQLIVATHSSDILRGFLEGTKGNVRILRLRRRRNQNFVSEADPKEIKDLWQDPVLRYSNALDGIFHEQTVICEDDSDCRLINAVADHLAISDDKQWQDTAYVPAGGKHGIPKIAYALRKVGVPVKAVFDLDFLSEEGFVKKAVEAFGGNWGEIGVKLEYIGDG